MPSMMASSLSALLPSALMMGTTSSTPATSSSQPPLSLAQRGSMYIHTNNQKKSKNKAESGANTAADGRPSHPAIYHKLKNPADAATSSVAPSMIRSDANFFSATSSSATDTSSLEVTSDFVVGFNAIPFFVIKGMNI
jgi:hypothetical protein